MGTDPPAANKETGDSCMTVVRGQDGYDYAYCLHNGGHSWDGGYTFAARAPIADPGPGKWKRYFDGAWNEPGVARQERARSMAAGSALLDHHRQRPSVLKWMKGGTGLAVSEDHVHFTPVLAQPSC